MPTQRIEKELKVELYCTTYNEEYLLPYMIEFYKGNIPCIEFHFYDNGSTDRTKEIIISTGCNLHSFNTGNEIRDDLLTQHKNECWKSSNADFIIVCDTDELVNISESCIANLKGNIAAHNAYDMIGSESPKDVCNGLRNPVCDKVFGFKPKEIEFMNFGVGAHSCSPVAKEGFTVEQYEVFPMYHMRYLGEDYIVNRYKEYSSRLSQINKQHAWGWHYSKSEEEIRNEYRDLLSKATKVR